MLERFDQLAIERALDPEELVEGLAEAFIALSRGEVVAPPRVQVSTERGYSLSMPVYRVGGPIMVKIVNVFDENVNRGLPSHHALICLFDSETGAATAIVDATGITATRTAAASALSTKLLAREDATVMTIVGAGVQAGPISGCCRLFATWTRSGSSPANSRWHRSWRSSTRGRAQSSSQKKGYGRAISSLSARTLERPSSTHSGSSRAPTSRRLATAGPTVSCRDPSRPRQLVR